jgi:hypothetical protein
MFDLQHNTGKRWKLFNRVFLVIIVLILFFGYMDAKNVQGMFALDAVHQAENGWDEHSNVWTVYWSQIQPVLVGLWIGVLAIIALIWYLITKDKSEATAIFLVPAIWIFFGVQDLFYFLFSPQTMSAIGCWANALMPVSWISDLLGEVCPTMVSFFISAFIGIILSWIVLFKLKYLE